MRVWVLSNVAERTAAASGNRGLSVRVAVCLRYGGQARKRRAMSIRAAASAATAVIDTAVSNLGEQRFPTWFPREDIVAAGGLISKVLSCGKWIEG